MNGPSSSDDRRGWDLSGVDVPAGEHVAAFFLPDIASYHDWAGPVLRPDHPGRSARRVSPAGLAAKFGLREDPAVLERLRGILRGTITGIGADEFDGLIRPAQEPR